MLKEFFIKLGLKKQAPQTYKFNLEFNQVTKKANSLILLDKFANTEKVCAILIDGIQKNKGIK